MAVDAESFRSALGQWPTGVALVTTVAGDGAWHGMTASSFSSVSLDPPLVLVCLDRELHTHRLLEATGVFAVSVLGRDQAAIGKRFAGMEPGIAGRERFTGSPWTPGPTGSPVLGSALAWLDCRIAHAYPGGDHTIFVGEVRAAATPRRIAPLLFHSRAWGQLADPLPDEVSVTDVALAAALPPGPDRDLLLAGLRAAGVGVRVPLAEAGPGTTVLLTDPAQAEAVPAGGVAEFGYRSPEQAAVFTDRLHRGGVATVARVPDAFAPGRAAAVLAAVDALVALGVGQIALDQGGGPLSPLRLRELLQDAAVRARPVPLRVGLRAGSGLGMANALTAMKSGVRHFDVAFGGVGGGLPAEELLHLAAAVDVGTRADRAALLTLAGRLNLPSLMERTAE